MARSSVSPPASAKAAWRSLSCISISPDSPSAWHSTGNLDELLAFALWPAVTTRPGRRRPRLVDRTDPPDCRRARRLLADRRRRLLERSTRSRAAGEALGLDRART